MLYTFVVDQGGLERLLDRIWEPLRIIQIEEGFVLLVDCEHSRALWLYLL